MDLRDDIREAFLKLPCCVITYRRVPRTQGTNPTPGSWAAVARTAGTSAKLNTFPFVGIASALICYRHAHNPDDMQVTVARQ
ncbi:hypothetical protein GCM10010430_34940 [Kitasatospora cystarginea]|uniref:Uncharacterized protein n=1 Tax=Kitasatospora cystarginea TaxID=58350 RepID=A0ABP5R4H0_9ACTN